MASEASDRNSFSFSCSSRVCCSSSRRPARMTSLALRYRPAESSASTNLLKWSVRLTLRVGISDSPGLSVDSWQDTTVGKICQSRPEGEEDCRLKNVNCKSQI